MQATKTLRIVDGGYFENSGVATRAMDIVIELEKHTTAPGEIDCFEKFAFP
jgi:hypothetical protein